MMSSPRSHDSSKQRARAPQRESDRTRRPQRPVRTCVGCGERDHSGELVSIVLDDEGHPVVDLAGRPSAFGGRGASVHPRRQCLERAARNGLSKGFRASVRPTSEALLGAVADAANRRVAGLLGAAHRGRHLAVGADSVAEAWALGSVELMLLTRDAAAARKLSCVAAAEALGRLAEWGDKSAMGTVLHRPDTAIIAVLDTGLASAVRTALAATGLVSPAFAGEQAKRASSVMNETDEAAQVVDESTEDR
ncbi:MAG: YlxR family protein [Polyangiaceae bacterium]